MTIEQIAAMITIAQKMHKTMSTRQFCQMIHLKTGFTSKEVWAEMWEYELVDVRDMPDGYTPDWTI